MKQVIVRVKDCRPTYSKTIARYYFYCVSSYMYDVLDCVKNLLPGQEIEIKVGNQYITWVSYEDMLEAINSGDYESERDFLYHRLLNDSSLVYYIKEYLPVY